MLSISRKRNSAVQVNGASSSHQRDWIRLTLVILLLIGAGLRLYRLNWDEFQHAHPDERHITWVATSISWPADSRVLFDPLRTTLNPFRWPPSSSSDVGEPRAFTYGHFPLYLMAAAAQGLSHISSPADGGTWADYDHIQLVGRAISALFDTLTILLVFLLAKELFGEKAGLLAAAFQTFTVQHIQLSHFAAFDAIMATFVVMAVWLAVRGARTGKARHFLLAGAAAGLAIGSLVRSAPVLLPVALAPLVRLEMERRQGRMDARRIWMLVGGAAGAVLIALLVFAITNPFAILDYQNFLKNIGEQGRMVRGAVDWPFTRQYRGTIPYLYQIEQQVRWAMGWPLGIAAFAGLAWAVWRAVRGRAAAGEYIMLAWVVPYFLINGAFMVKFMRYMVILTPFLGLLGAALLTTLAERLAGTRWRRLGPALIAVALAWTAAYALAFFTIYTRPHTWIQASRWIYENVPDGSVIAVEHWDDELPKPLREPGMNSGAHGYQHITLPLYEEDTPAKYEIIKTALQQADYIILASNRLYGSIPRLPKRYPMTIAYYDLLFRGELGFELVKTFTSYPRLGPLVWVDDHADESFTVYDHPKPLIFKKVRTLSDEEIWEKLGGKWEGAIPGWVGDKGPAGGRPTARKSLLLDRPVGELPVVDDFRWNALASRHAGIAVLVWWAAVVLLGLIAAPLAFVVFDRLPDRGWAFSKPLALLCIGYANWLGASLRLTQNRTPIIALFALGLAGLSASIAWRRREAFLAHLRRQWRLLLTIEGLFAFSYGAFVLVRLLNPDLWQPWTGGEKPMEFAFLNAVLKSAWFPPYDPYFAHGYINYYYYGLYLVSLLIKLTGIAPAVAFNLAVPTLFAMTVCGAFGVGYALAAGLRRARGDWRRGIAGGLLSAALVAVMGNLAAFAQLQRAVGSLGGSTFTSNIPGLQPLVRLIPGLLQLARGVRLPPFDYWAPSRVITNTINEFPFWSFLFADLHPHMIAIAFALTAMAGVLNMLCRPAVPGELAGRRAVAVLAPYLPGWGELASWLALPLLIGALGAINTWDLPTYIGLAVLAYLLRVGRDAHWRLALAKTAVFAGGLAVLCYVLYLPFYRHYAAMSVGIGLTRGRTDGWQWLTIWGCFLFLALSYYLVELRRRGERVPILRWVRMIMEHWTVLPRLEALHRRLVREAGPLYHTERLALGIGLLTAVALALLKYWPGALAALVLIGGGLLFRRRRAGPQEDFVNLLVFVGFLLLLGVEVFFLRDFLQGGDHYRMNTLFKFYIQAWVLLGAALGAALPSIWEQVGQRWSPAWAGVWQAGLVFLLAASFLFVPLAVPQRVTDRFPNATPPIGTLDGMAFMTVGKFFWPDPSYEIDLRYDYEALRWLTEHVRGTPVVAEAGIGYYREGGLRVATYTGLPTLVGMHQNEQRYGEMVGEREELTRRLFDSPDIAQAQAVIDRLDIALIYIGQLERAPGVYSPAGIAKFEEMARLGLLQEVYRNPRTVIYAVPGRTIPGLWD